MKRLLIVLLALSLFAGYNVNAQAVVTIPDVTELPGPVTIPVTVDFSGVVSDVCSFDFHLDYNPLVLTLNSISSEDPSLALGSFINDLPNGIITWSATPGNGTDMTGVIFNLNFTYAGGSSDIDFDLINSEVANCPGSVITQTYNNGSITESALVPVSNWAIFLGIGLMIVFVALGFRKYIFA